MAIESEHWNRVYDKIEKVNERIGETNVELAKVTTAMAGHIESDTECFNRIEQNFRELSEQINDVCLSKKDAKKEARNTSAIWAGVVSILVAIISACAQIAGH